MMRAAAGSTRKRRAGVAIGMAAGLLALSPSSAAAQLVRGIVVDSVSRAPLPGVTVSLRLLVPDTTVATASSDVTGAFSVAAPRPGTYFVTARKVGYATASVLPTRLDAGSVRVLELRMVSLAVAMDTVVSRTSFLSVTAGRTWYAQHFAEGKGMFINGLELTRAGISACDFIAGLPGLRMTTGAVGGSGIVCGVPDMSPIGIITTRSANRCVLAQVDHSLKVISIDSANLYLEWIHKPLIKGLPGFAPPVQDQPMAIPFLAIKGIEVYLNNSERPHDFSISPWIDQTELRDCAWVQFWTTIAW